MTPAVTVYSKPQCVQCDRTKSRLDREGVDYTSVDITTDQDAYDYVSQIGYQAAPVVVVNNGEDEDTHWYGYRPDMIRQYILNGGK